MGSLYIIFYNTMWIYNYLKIKHLVKNVYEDIGNAWAESFFNLIFLFFK